ncbi:MAG: phosphodiester glycosidase family protein, partial [Muribaculaceae bacterium]|nr:phosphodiester glycosidase family protein [Muribaculaceae bacterium]
MKKLILSLVACAAMSGANASGKWVLGPYDYTADTIYHATAGPGITTTAIRLSSANGANKTNIFYSTIDLTNPDLELRGVQPQDKKGVKETVKAMGDRKNTQGNGHYITGVNGDFFNMSGSPTYTNGHSMIDGTVYNFANGGEYWHIWASYAVVEGAKDIRIQQNVSITKSMDFPDKTEYPYIVNGWRGANVLVLFTSEKASTETNEWGSECALKLVSGSLDDNDATFEVTSAAESGKGNMTVPAGGYVLSGNGTAASLVQKLKIGDKISTGTSVTVDGNTINPNQVVGGCSMIVMNGELAPAKYFDKTVIDHFATNQARTVIGYNKDRTQLILLVADKYSSCTSADAEKKLYGASTGMVLERMGHIMLHLGCYTAMNFDGGGSSQLYNKEFGIRNVPYGGDSYRPVANGFFAVSTTPADDKIAALEVRQKNVSVANGEKFIPTVYGYNKYGVLVNKNVTGFTFSVAPSLGTVSGTTFTAGNAKGSTVAVVSLDGVKCGVCLHTNGGGSYVTSGDDKAPIMVAKPYKSDKPMGIDREQINLTERWHFVNTAYNDGWDGTAPNWASEDAIKSKSCPRFATALNGKFYTVDMKTMSIAE